MKKLFFFFLPAVFFVSCKFIERNSSGKIYNVASADSLSCSMISIDTTDAICKSKYHYCPHIKFSFPVFKTTDSSLNTYLSSEINKMMLFKGDSGYYATVDDCIDNFFSESRGIKNQGYYDGESSEWEIEKNVKVLKKKGKYLTLEYSDLFYEGGAHPNSNTIFKTFDLILKKEVKASELFINLEDTALQRIGEKYFRKNMKIADTTRLSDIGYFVFGEGDDFEDGPAYGRFRLNDNYALTNDGIEFLYNAYEIGPYAVGPSSFTIPYSELRPFLKLTIW